MNPITFTVYFIFNKLKANDICLNIIHFTHCSRFSMVSLRYTVLYISWKMNFNQKIKFAEERRGEKNVNISLESVLHDIWQCYANTVKIETHDMGTNEQQLIEICRYSSWFRHPLRQIQLFFYSLMLIVAKAKQMWIYISFMWMVWTINFAVSL